MSFMAFFAPALNYMWDRQGRSSENLCNNIFPTSPWLEGIIVWAKKRTSVAQHFCQTYDCNTHGLRVIGLNKLWPNLHEGGPYSEITTYGNRVDIHPGLYIHLRVSMKRSFLLVSTNSSIPYLFFGLLLFFLPLFSTPLLPPSFSVVTIFHVYIVCNFAVFCLTLDSPLDSSYTATNPDSSLTSLGLPML